MLTSPAMIPVSHTDPINRQILAVAEDQIQGFAREPFSEIAKRSGVPLDTVLERLRAMLGSGTVRRIRQTLIATNLAEGALVAWRVPAEKMDSAFDFLLKNDPFSGHVVVRSTEAKIPGAAFKLWTTLKVPAGIRMEDHCELLSRFIGADAFRLMPAKGIFALGVGHVRRQHLKPGDKGDAPAKMIPVATVELTPHEWEVLTALKREFRLDEVVEPAWEGRAAEAGVDLEEFYRVAESLAQRRVIGRFSAFLEHVKPTVEGERVTKFNGLFHWAVPPERVVEAGGEVGRHQILTHCYWRDGGPEFNDVNIMAVAHGTEKEAVLAHKAAIDRHLEECGIPVSYSNVFWGGKSEIKPSEISPVVYRQWREKIGRGEIG